MRKYYPRNKRKKYYVHFEDGGLWFTIRDYNEAKKAMIEAEFTCTINQLNGNTFYSVASKEICKETGMTCIQGYI